jgi:hypothetical protein
MVSVGCCDPAHHGAICRIVTVHAPLLQPFRPVAKGGSMGADHTRTCCRSRCGSPNDRHVHLGVHQHAGCIARNKDNPWGRSPGGLMSKIHAVVDTNGLPVRLGLTAGESHDSRLATGLYCGCDRDQCYLPIVHMTQTGSEPLSTNGVRGPTFRPEAPRSTGISATRPSTRAAISNRVASTSPCTNSGSPRSRRRRRARR